MIEQTRRPARGLAGWTTRDILVTAAIALVFALVLLPLYLFAPLIDLTLGPVTRRLLGGAFFIPPFVVMQATRRPGAAVLCGTLMGLVQTPFTPLGPILIIGSAVFGLIGELPFLVTRYRRFGVGFLVVSGAVIGLLTGLLDFVPNGGLNLAVGAQVLFLLFNTLSGAAAGWISVRLVAALRQSGVFKQVNSESTGGEV